ncbi:hypothetical protein K491DRAFT_607490, partial [Lophiostoma macrostomum CBS 122681]
MLRDKLRPWSGQDKLIVAHHYFWRYGMTLQRTLPGLIWSILYQIFSQCPDFIERALGQTQPSHTIGTQTFSDRILQAALRNTLAAAAESDIRLFILIDGLDEFDDRDATSMHPPMRRSDERDLIDFLHVFDDLPHVKLCISSRPENIFKDSFGQRQGRSFYMHELTRDDIRVFVQQTLEEDSTFKRLALEDLGYKALVNELIDVANGVFLWVHLASRSLLQGITDADRISDLQRTLRSLPLELDGMYRYILGTIDLKYQRSAAIMLLAMSRISPEQPSELPVFFYGDDQEYTDIMSKHKFTLQDLARVNQSMSRRVNAHCRGLLEVRSDPVEGMPTRVPAPLLGITSTRVQVSHRTVKEYLMMTE